MNQVNRLELADFEIEYRDLPGEESAVVLLHEGLGSAALWRDLPEQLNLRTGRRVVAYSRPGYGRSSFAPTVRQVDFMHREALETLPLLLRALEIEAPILVGHSDGASIALIFAAHHPSHSQGLVLEAPHVFVEEVTVEEILRLGDLYRDPSTGLRSRMAHYHRDVDATFWSWHKAWTSEEFRDWNLEALLSRIEAPALLIQGADDEYGTLDQVDAIERQIVGPVETLVLARCGHTPHRDRPRAALEAMVRFIGAKRVRP